MTPSSSPIGSLSFLFNFQGSVDLGLERREYCLGCWSWCDKIGIICCENITCAAAFFVVHWFRSRVPSEIHGIIPSIPEYFPFARSAGSTDKPTAAYYPLACFLWPCCQKFCLMSRVFPCVWVSWQGTVALSRTSALILSNGLHCGGEDQEHKTSDDGGRVNPWSRGWAIYLSYMYFNHSFLLLWSFEFDIKRHIIIALMSPAAVNYVDNAVCDV
jgi:hypothetical protein